MIERQHGVILFECDGCGEVVDTETKDFAEAREQMKSRGWRARKNGAAWSHHCETCKP